MHSNKKGVCIFVPKFTLTAKSYGHVFDMFKPNERNPTYDATGGDTLNLMKTTPAASDTNLVPEQIRTILDAPNTDYRTVNPQNH